MARYLYSELSRLIQARQTCANRMNGWVESPNQNTDQEWFFTHSEEIERPQQRLARRAILQLFVVGAPSLRLVRFRHARGLGLQCL